MRREASGALAALFCVGLAVSASAAVPIAVWSDFSQPTSGGCTLTVNGTVADDGSVTLTEGGLVLSLPESVKSGKAVSIVAEIEGGTFTTSYTTIASLALASDTITIEANDTTLRQSYAGYTGTTYYGSGSWTAGAHQTLAVTYYGPNTVNDNATSGTTTYINGTSIANATGLRWSGQTLSSITLGIAGMKVHKLAVYASKVAAEEIPAELPNSYTATLTADGTWAGLQWTQDGTTADPVATSALPDAAWLTLVNEGTETRTVTDDVSIPAARRLTTKGDITFSGNNELRGRLEVASGTNTFYAGDRKLGGTITILPGATLVNSQTADALNYDGDTQVHVYGTLNFGSTRWTVHNTRNKIFVYAGATVSGAGQSTNGALDPYNGRNTINFLPSPFPVENPTITLSAAIRARNVVDLAIAEGVRVNFSSQQYTVGNFAKSGTGTLCLQANATFGQTVSGPIEVATGKTLTLSATAQACTYAGEGTLTATEDGISVVGGVLKPGAGMTSAVSLGANTVLDFGTGRAFSLASVAATGTAKVRATQQSSEAMVVITGTGLSSLDSLTVELYSADGTKLAGRESSLSAGTLTILPASSDPVLTMTDESDTWSTNAWPTSGAFRVDCRGLTVGKTLTIPAAESARTFSKVTILGGEAPLTLAVGANNTVQDLEISGHVIMAPETVNGITNAPVVAAESVLEVPVAAGTTPEPTLSKAVGGSGTFLKSGAGTLGLAAHISTLGGTTVAGGTLKLLANGKIQSTTDAYTTAGNVCVQNGATLDVNGKLADSWMNTITLEGGSTLANTGDDVNEGARQLAGIVLTGDATLDLTGRIGIVASGYGAATLNLGSHTLTKKGTGTLGLANTTVQNGTIVLQGGILNGVANGDTAKAVALSGVTLEVAEETTLEPLFPSAILTFSGAVTKRGAGAATIGCAIAGSGALTVSDGSLTMNGANTYTGRVTIESTGTLDISGSGSRLYKNEYVAGEDGQVTLRGTLKTGNWTYGGSLGALAHNAGKISIDGGTVVFAGAEDGSYEDTEGSSGNSRGFTVTANGATFVVPEGGTYAKNANTVAGVTLNGPLTLKGKGKYVLSFALAPAAAQTLTIGDGTDATTVELAGRILANQAVVVKEKATLNVTNTDATEASGAIPFSATAGFTVDGTLTAQGGVLYRAVSGSGIISVPAKKSYTLGRDQSGGTTGLSGFTGTLSIGGTLTCANWYSSTPYSVSGSSIAFTEAAGLLQGGGDSTVTVTLSEGKTLSGSGKIVPDVTFAQGSIIDATAGAPTCQNTVTLPASGTVTVKADAYGPVLTKGGLATESFALSESSTAVADGTFLSTASALVLVAPPKSSGTTPVTDAAVAGKVADLAAQAGVYEVKSVTASTGRSIEGAALFDGVSTVTKDADATTGKVVVAYDFGIAEVSQSATGEHVSVTAKVRKDASTAATFAEGVTVGLYAQGVTNPVATKTLTAADDRSAVVFENIPVETVKGRSLTVKATKTN